jgi:flagella basal body P-ring formation protein FlgA
VTALESIPVLNKPLARNDIITVDDLDLVRQPIGQTSGGTVFEVEQLVGMQLTRALDAGATLRLSNLRKPDVIKRGQQVTLVSGAKGLEVRIAGKALGNAAEGEIVTVSNLSSGKRVQGIAHADGTVSVQ